MIHVPPLFRQASELFQLLPIQLLQIRPYFIQYHHHRDSSSIMGANEDLDHPFTADEVLPFRLLLPLLLLLLLHGEGELT